jgi:alkanesulfonate monooxygenase SsuD/methylene tetrahydromethanopterin reductase-like flavin-dependent oxidoreductase (luciferase family)
MAIPGDKAIQMVRSAHTQAAQLDIAVTAVVVDESSRMLALDSRAEILLRCSIPFCDRVLQLSGKRNPTVRAFMHDTGRGRLENPWVGSPKESANRLEEWFTERACDGFVVGSTYPPGTFEEFVRLVIPEFQRRGVDRKEYAGTTLRVHRGLVCPEVGA